MTQMMPPVHSFNNNHRVTGYVQQIQSPSVRRQPRNRPSHDITTVFR